MVRSPAANAACSVLLLSADAPLNRAGAKFIIDKNGNVVDRNGDSPMASEAKIKALL